MNRLEEKMCAAVCARKDWKSADKHTRVKVVSEDEVRVYFWRTCIFRIKDGVRAWSMVGPDKNGRPHIWNTRTTRSRLAALTGIAFTVRKGVLYANGKKVERFHNQKV